MRPRFCCSTNASKSSKDSVKPSETSRHRQGIETSFPKFVHNKTHGPVLRGALCKAALRRARAAFAAALPPIPPPLPPLPSPAREAPRNSANGVCVCVYWYWYSCWLPFKTMNKKKAPSNKVSLAEFRFGLLATFRVWRILVRNQSLEALLGPSTVEVREAAGWV